MSNTIIPTVKVIYRDLNKENIDELISIYDKNVTFVDPVNAIHGREKLLDHFKHSYADVQSCEFLFDDAIEIIQPNTALLSWKMILKHKSLNSGNAVEVDGSSYLSFSDKITFHRDWFDLGQMIYENLPLVGSAIKLVKSRLKCK